MKVKRVGIVGAGVMGSGIAHLVARSTKCEVMLTDVSEDVLAKASAYHRKYVQRMSKRKDVDADLARSVLERVKTTLDMEDLSSSQIVIECVTEKLETKKKIFRQVEKVVADDAILASGTSSLRPSSRSWRSCAVWRLPTRRSSKLRHSANALEKRSSFRQTLRGLSLLGWERC